MSESQANIRDVLDERVKQYSAEVLDRPGVVTGWVLCVTSTRFDDKGTAMYAYDYSTSPDVDMVRAVGLVHLCHQQMLRDVAGPPATDDD